MNKKFFHSVYYLSRYFRYFGMTTNASAEENGEFRVGMEAGYAPFNWSQKNDAHGAVPIQGNNLMQAAMMFKFLKNCRWFRS